MSHTEQPISIHHIRHLSKQNFFFKSKDLLNLVLFAHLVNFSLSVIITQNKMNQSINIRHNQCLDYLTELNYKKCYYVAVNESIRDLMIQRSAVTYLS